MYDFLIVGAGFAGSVLAERLSSFGKSVIIIDRRNHVAGNAYDEIDTHSILTHKYGPHIFHTNSEEVYQYLSRFTEWHQYEHRVLAAVEGMLLPMPINLDTVNRLYSLNLNEEEIKGYFERVREKRSIIKTSEDLIVNTVGWDLYRKFYQNYTRKQWGLDPSELSASVAARIPVRTNKDDRYFSDKFQFMPKNGYTAMFSNMLMDKRITLVLGESFQSVRNRVKATHVIYTGPIDEYFNFCYGPLPYRSLKFDHQHLTGVKQFQPVGTVNYPNENSYTRITEFKHLTGQECPGTSIVFEYPQSEGDPYYPIPRIDNEELYKKYRKLADSESDVSFVGRLAEYRYFNMDQVVQRALNMSASLLS